jgi:hypothetical protein
MTTVDEQTKYRVEFAIRVMLRGGSTNRKFDSCFENNDLHTVAAMVYARALKNPRLMLVLPRYLCLESCQASYERVKGPTPANLHQKEDRGK